MFLRNWNWDATVEKGANSSAECLKVVENISFSLKELISYCEKNNFKVRLCDNSPSNSPTTIEIEPYEPYNQNEKGINCYLKSIK